MRRVAEARTAAFGGENGDGPTDTLAPTIRPRSLSVSALLDVWLLDANDNRRPRLFLL